MFLGYCDNYLLFQSMIRFSYQRDSESIHMIVFIIMIHLILFEYKLFMKFYIYYVASKHLLCCLYHRSLQRFTHKLVDRFIGASML